jgi:hypothetical protein
MLWLCFQLVAPPHHIVIDLKRSWTVYASLRLDENHGSCGLCERDVHTLSEVFRHRFLLLLQSMLDECLACSVG